MIVVLTSECPKVKRMMHQEHWLVRLKPTAYGRVALKGSAKCGLVGRRARNAWRETGRQRVTGMCASLRART